MILEQDPLCSRKWEAAHLSLATVGTAVICTHLVGASLFTDWEVHGPAQGTSQ